MHLNPHRVVALALSSTLLGIGVMAILLSLMSPPDWPLAIGQDVVQTERATGAEADEWEVLDAERVEQDRSWCEVQPGEGTLLLITRLTIPGIFNEKVRAISLARRGLSEGYTFAPFETGTGSRGGGGYSGSIRVKQELDGEKAPDGFVQLELNYSWTSRIDSGFIDQVVELRIGEPAELDLKHGRRLTVQWR